MIEYLFHLFICFIIYLLQHESVVKQYMLIWSWIIKKRRLWFQHIENFSARLLWIHFSVSIFLNCSFEYLYSNLMGALLMVWDAFTHDKTGFSAHRKSFVSQLAHWNATDSILRSGRQYIAVFLISRLPFIQKHSLTSCYKNALISNELKFFCVDLSFIAIACVSRAWISAFDWLTH